MKLEPYQRKILEALLTGAKVRLYRGRRRWFYPIYGGEDTVTRALPPASEIAVNLPRSTEP